MVAQFQAVVEEQNTSLLEQKNELKAAHRRIELLEEMNRLLDEFEGVLQADGFSGYSKVCTENNLTRIGCWDHARRKFVEAEKALILRPKPRKAP